MYIKMHEDNDNIYRRCQRADAMAMVCIGKTVACTVGYDFTRHKNANTIEQAKAIESAMKRENNVHYVWWWIIEPKKSTLSGQI